jgi:MFS family permease
MNFHGSVPFFVFFSCIGIGFMLVEISQMQRLAVFLGHPSYSLTVVLFSLLLAGSLGSFLTRRVRFEVTAKPVLRSFSFLLLALFIVGLLTPIVLPVFRGATTPLRILLAVILLFVQGIFMGMAFPMGMNLAQRHSPRLSPWYWGINGAASVFASVLAVMISLSASISASYWTGLAAYGAAFISVSLMARRSLTKVAGKTPVNS